PAAAATESVNFALAPLSSQVAPDTTFRISVRLSGGKDIASVPVQIQYDPAQLTLVNVNAGDYLGRDGQAVALVHRDDGPGNITINASRPPGVAGVSGEGVVCVLTFQAKAAGESLITISHPAAVTSAQQQLTARGATARVVVQ